MIAKNILISQLSTLLFYINLNAKYLKML